MILVATLLMRMQISLMSYREQLVQVVDSRIHCQLFDTFHKSKQLKENKQKMCENIKFQFIVIICVAVYLE